MSTSGFDAIVIGGGGNGLVAAARLGKAGRRVLVVDSADRAGGQRRVVEFAPGFSAAALSSDPGWLPPEIGGALGFRGLEPVAADTGVTVAFGRGAFLSLSCDQQIAADAIKVHSASDAAKWGEFTTRLRALAGFLEVLYRAPAPDVDVRSLGELLPLLDLGRKFRALGRRDMIEFLRALPMSVSDLLDDWFEFAALKALVAAGGVQGLRQGPRSGGTGLVLLHHLVGAAAGAVRGRLPWRGGPEAFTNAALDAATRFGVTFRAGASVAQISIRDERVEGVVLAGGEEIRAAQVLSTADPAKTILEWVDPVWLDPEFVREVDNIRQRGCTAFVLYALDTFPEFPGLPSRDALAGVVSLTPDLVALERAADAAKYGTIAARPHVELTVPTLLWPALAPAGKHVAVARVHYAPQALKDGDGWSDARCDALAASVTSQIEALSPGFGSRVLHRAFWSPVDLDERFGLRGGASSQGELALDQILFMRPVAGWGRHTTPISGLYWGGVGTHPGPGILGGAGWLAAGRLLDRERAAR
jgi:phytoene dehydrogenase-like protein